MSDTAVNGSGSPLTMEPEGGVAVHDAPTTTDQANMEADRIEREETEGFEEDIVDESETQTPSIDDIKAGLQNLSGGIATAQDIENAARAEEGLPPLEAAGLLDFGPFNPDNALKAIFEKEAEVQLLRSAWQRKKEAASEAKKEYETGSTALLHLIESFKNRRLQALNPSQPYLRDVAGDAPASSLSASRCPWEREHPGQSCPICTAAQAKDITPALESEVHPEHEGHKAVAELARVENVLRPLAAKLERVHLFVEASELQSLSTEDLNALIAYAEEPTPIPPHILTRCCVAEVPGTVIQICRTCGMSLRNQTDNAAENREYWYPEGALVGFDCEGRPTGHVDEPTTEPDHDVGSNAVKAAKQNTADRTREKVNHRYTRRHNDPKKAKAAKKKGRR